MQPCILTRFVIGMNLHGKRRLLGKICKDQVIKEGFRNLGRSDRSSFRDIVKSFFTTHFAR